MVQLNLEQAYYNHIVRGLNKQLASTIKWLGSKEAQRFFNERSQNIHTFWKHSRMREEWDNITQSNAESSRDYMERIYKVGAKHGYNQLNRIVGYTKADRETLFHLKQYNYNLIKNVNQDTIQNIRKILTQAEAEGLHPFQTAEHLRDEGLQGIKGLSPIQRARMIARTESRRASTLGSAQAYVNYGVKEAELVTYSGKDANRETMEADGVCDDCIEIYEGNPYPVIELAQLIPVHVNCRCVISPVIEDVEKIINEEAPAVLDKNINQNV